MTDRVNATIRFLAANDHRTDEYELKKAFNRLALLVHPDKVPGYDDRLFKIASRYNTDCKRSTHITVNARKLIDDTLKCMLDEEQDEEQHYTPVSPSYSLPDESDDEYSPLGGRYPERSSSSAQSGDYFRAWMEEEEERAEEERNTSKAGKKRKRAPKAARKPPTRAKKSKKDVVDLTSDSDDDDDDDDDQFQVPGDRMKGYIAENAMLRQQLKKSMFDHRAAVRNQSEETKRAVELAVRVAMKEMAAVHERAIKNAVRGAINSIADAINTTSDTLLDV
jgi:hypothetical protein